MKNKKREWSDDQLKEAVKVSLSYAQVIRKLGLKPSGSNYLTIKKRIQELNISISHMTGKAWNQGERYKNFSKKINLKEILIKDSKWTNTFHLKERLIKEGIKEKKCECCGLSEWLGKEIPLELHHINGIKNDLRIENLMLLCPNCHAQTDNYRGKNIKK